MAELPYADATLEIDLAALAHNYRYLRDQAEGAVCAGVVKANAYGLGMEAVSRRLWEEGCRDFFVATLDEAVELREIVPQAEIYIFHGFRRGQEQAFLEHRLVPVVNTLQQLEQWDALAALQPQKLGAVLHVDTGMNRLGITMAEAEALVLRDFQHMELRYLMSHLACVSEPDHPLTTEQLRRVNRLRKQFDGVKVTLANSGGVLRGKCYHFDMVRPGCSLYGVNNTPDLQPGLRPVVTVKARILQLRGIDTSQTVGYGATAEVAAGSTLATIPVGYADGYLRQIGNRGAYVTLGGQKAPLVGRVSMDMVVADVTGLGAQPGDEVELLGQHMTIDMLAELADTIGYELLTRLGQRYRRIYTNP